MQYCLPHPTRARCGSRVVSSQEADRRMSPVITPYEVRRGITMDVLAMVEDQAYGFRHNDP